MKVTAEQRVLSRFGKTVRARRIELRLSQEELAEAADLHRTYIGDIERGTRNIGLLNVVKLGDALKTSASELLKGISFTAGKYLI